MFWPGVATLWTALFCGLAAMYGYFRADRGAAEYLGFARRAYAIFVASVVATAAILMTLLLNHRFDVSYVASYSSRDHYHPLPDLDVLGRQEGSFLLWLWARSSGYSSGARQGTGSS
jgi:cytochrome c biogenesis factor